MIMGEQNFLAWLRIHEGAHDAVMELERGSVGRRWGQIGVGSPDYVRYSGSYDKDFWFSLSMLSRYLRISSRGIIKWGCYSGSVFLAALMRREYKSTRINAESSLWSLSGSLIATYLRGKFEAPIVGLLIFLEVTPSLTFLGFFWNLLFRQKWKYGKCCYHVVQWPCLRPLMKKESPACPPLPERIWPASRSHTS